MQLGRIQQLVSLEWNLDHQLVCTNSHLLLTHHTVWALGTSCFWGNPRDITCYPNIVTLYHCDNSLMGAPQEAEDEPDKVDWFKERKMLFLEG